MQRLQLAIGRGGDLLLQAVQQMGTPLRGIGQAWAQAFGVQAQAQHIHRRLQQPWRHTVQQQRYDGVGGHQVPVPVHGQGRVGFVALEHQVHRLACCSQIGMLQRACLVHGAKPAATRSPLRSRSGTDRRSARRSTISRLGCARPVST